MSLGALTSAHMQLWFERIVRDHQPTAWQIRQTEEALRLFMHNLLELRWAATFDWAYWRRVAQSLTGAPGISSVLEPPPVTLTTNPLTTASSAAESRVGKQA